jgi:hypothetical protein
MIHDTIQNITIHDTKCDSTYIITNLVELYQWAEKLIFSQTLTTTFFYYNNTILHKNSLRQLLFQ